MDMRIACYNANGIGNEGKRRGIVRDCMKGKVDVLGLSETHLKGQGMCECKRGDSGGLWEGMEGGAVWTGLEESYKGKAKEGCAILVCERVWKGVTDYGWKGSRIVWMKGKIGVQ